MATPKDLLISGFIKALVLLPDFIFWPLWKVFVLRNPGLREAVNVMNATLQSLLQGWCIIIRLRRQKHINAKEIHYLHHFYGPVKDFRIGGTMGRRLSHRLAGGIAKKALHLVSLPALIYSYWWLVFRGREAVKCVRYTLSPVPLFCLIHSQAEQRLFCQDLF